MYIDPIWLDDTVFLGYRYVAWWFFINGGAPKQMVYGKSDLEMDENLGYPYFKKPPYEDIMGQ